MHAAQRIALGHFLVDDAPARGHPLQVAGPDGAAVAHAVAVLDRAGQDVGDGFDAAMRMPREAGEIIVRDVVAKIVEQEEGIEVGGIAEAERAAQMHARAFESGLGLDQAFDGSNGHIVLLVQFNCDCHGNITRRRRAVNLAWCAGWGLPHFRYRPYAARATVAPNIWEQTPFRTPQTFDPGKSLCGNI